MKKTINKISRYIIIVWVIVFVLFLICAFKKYDDFITPMFLLLSLVTIMLIVVNIIHLIWMIKEKRKPQNLKGDIIIAVIMVLLLTINDIYSNQFSLNEFLSNVVIVLIISVLGKIFRYIYSWEEQNSAL